MVITRMSNMTNTPLSAVMQSEGGSSLLIAFMSILSFFSVVGTVGNSMVLYVYVRKRNKLASTIFIITLACTDLFTCIVIIPYTMTLEYLAFKAKYDFVCKLYMFFITYNVPFSAFIMVAIAVDRYLCICHPFLHLLNARRAKVTIILLALIAFALGIITSLNFGVFLIQPEPDSTLEDKLFSYFESNTSVEHQNTLMSNLTRIHSISLEEILTQPKRYAVVYTGSCLPNGLLFSKSFTNAYQKLYSSFFVIVFVVVVILYALIYKFVTVRRAKRRRQRIQRVGSPSLRDTTKPSGVQTMASISNDSVRSKTLQVAQAKPKRFDIFSRQCAIREKGTVANIRTAGMLFVVTAVFIIVFLPAWLMAHQLIPYNMLIFYMYFFYNVANPMIYAFMNKAFRRDLRDLLAKKRFQPF